MEYFKGKIVLALDNDLKAFGLLKIKIWGNVITFRCNIFSKRTKKKNAWLEQNLQAFRLAGSVFTGTRNLA